MAEVAISYGNGWNHGLKDAADDSKKVAKKLDSYESELNSKIYTTLNSYPGDKSGNITRALKAISDKKTQLSDDQNKYEKYEEALDNLREDCASVDSQVARRIKTLSRDFKNANSIKTNVITDAIDFLLTKAKNSCSFLRKIGEFFAGIKNGANNLMTAIKNWYNYHGGKDLLQGVAVAVLEIGIAIAACVATIATLGTAAAVIAVIVGAATVISCAIAVGDGVMNLVNEVKAAATDDPVQAKRLHNRNNMADSILGDATSNIAARERAGKAINVTKAIADGIVIVYNLSTAYKAVVKWSGAGESAKLSEVLRGSKNKIVDNGKDLWATLKTGDFKAMFKTGGKYLWKDFTSNVKSNFVDKFHSGTVKDTASLAKDCMSIAKGVISGELVETTFGFALDNLTAYQYEADKTRAIGDVKGSLEKMGKLWKNGGTVISAFSKDSSVNITMPKIDVLTFNTVDFSFDSNFSANYSFGAA